MTKDDLSGTLEHPACILFSANQQVRTKYRQTGYFVAGQASIDFLDEWYWMCTHPRVLKNIARYAPFNEETIANVLLWKLHQTDGLPLLYINGGIDMIDRVYHEIGFSGYDNLVSEWTKIPASRERLLFFHNEKRADVMEKMIDKLQTIFRR